MSGEQFKVEEPWVETDTSTNRLEFAKTDGRTPNGEEIYAMRDSYNPGNMLFVPRSHILNTVNSVQDGRLARLGIRGTHS